MTDPRLLIRAEIAGVLLVPDDPALLADGPCGARPPRAWWCPAAARIQPGEPDWHESNRSVYLSREDADVWLDHREALVLGWDGKPVNHAGSWLPPAATCGWLGYLVVLLTRGAWETVEEDRRLAVAHFSRFGTVVLLDADGREVSVSPESTAEAPSSNRSSS